MDPKLLNVLKLCAAALVAAAGSVITLKATGTVEVSQWLSDAAVSIAALGSAFGIVSSGLKPEPTAPDSPRALAPAPTPPVAP